MTKCPHCFSTLTNTDFVWVCRTGRCEQTPDREATRYSVAPVRSGQIFALSKPPEAKSNWAPPHRVDCPTCNEAMDDSCPACHGALLPDWRAAQATCIAMNGARATGKSLYIAVVVKQLQRLAVNLGSTMHFGDDRTRDVYREVYERPLFEQRGLMAPTPRADTSSSYQRDPLIFSLGMIKGLRRYVVLRDVAGEEMESPPERAGHLAFLANADAILFMFDTLAVPSVRDKLVDLIPAQLQSGGDPLVVLNNLLRVVGNSNPRLGVILSKFDALQELRNVDDVTWSAIMSNSGAAFLRDPTELAPKYDEADGLQLHEEVRSLLYKLGAAPIVLTVQNSHDGRAIPHRFFAVSTLGESPDGRQLHSRGIAPYRCLDPVKWALAGAGVL